jgi:ATP-binding cassette subfamily B (MDR/TAP) protein 7
VEATLSSTPSPATGAASSPPATPAPSLSDWSIIRKLVTNIWPRSGSAIKIRVTAAIALLVAGKVLNVQVPFWFKEIVDGLNMDVTEAGTVWMVVGWSILGCASSLSVP